MRLLTTVGFRVKKNKKRYPERAAFGSNKNIKKKLNRNFAEFEIIVVVPLAVDTNVTKY